MPFGEYEGMQDCIDKNPKAENPGAYCAQIHFEITGEWPAEARKAMVWIGELDESPSLDWLPENIKKIRPLITGRAIHPVKTYHPLEWPNERVYLEAELIKCAQKFVGTTPFLDHYWPQEGWKVVAMAYADGELKYAIQPREGPTLEAIRSGEIQHTSIEFNWMVPGGGLKFVDGVAPYGFDASHISFLKDMEAGDPSTTVHLWEGKIIPGLKARLGGTREASKFISMSREEVDKTLNLEEKLEWSLLKDRAIIFHGEVEEDSCKKAVRRLEYLGKESKEPIHIILNSVGGGVYNGLLVFDTIKNLTREGITVICEARGLAASMGSIILQAGTKRLASPHTRFLIHEVSSFSWGETTKLEEQTEELRKLNDMLNQIYADRTGKTLEEINILTKKTDYWMSAKEALNFKLIDEIVEKGSPIFESMKKFTGRLREFAKLREQFITSEQKECVERCRGLGMSPNEIAQECEVPLDVLTSELIESSVRGKSKMKKKIREQGTNIPVRPVVPVGPVTIEQKVEALEQLIATLQNQMANVLGLLGVAAVEGIKSELIKKLGKRELAINRRLVEACTKLRRWKLLREQVSPTKESRKLIRNNERALVKTEIMNVRRLMAKYPREAVKTKALKRIKFLNRLLKCPSCLEKRAAFRAKQRKLKEQEELTTPPPVEPEKITGVEPLPEVGAEQKPEDCTEQQVYDPILKQCVQKPHVPPAPPHTLEQPIETLPVVTPGEEIIGPVPGEGLKEGELVFGTDDTAQKAYDVLVENGIQPIAIEGTLVIIHSEDLERARQVLEAREIELYMSEAVPTTEEECKNQGGTWAGGKCTLPEKPAEGLIDSMPCPECGAILGDIGTVVGTSPPEWDISNVQCAACGADLSNNPKLKDLMESKKLKEQTNVVGFIFDNHDDAQEAFNLLEEAGLSPTLEGDEVFVSKNHQAEAEGILANMKWHQEILESKRIREQIAKCPHCGYSFTPEQVQDIVAGVGVEWEKCPECGNEIPQQTIEDWRTEGFWEGKRIREQLSPADEGAIAAEIEIIHDGMTWEEILDNIITGHPEHPEPALRDLVARIRSEDWGESLKIIQKLKENVGETPIAQAGPGDCGPDEEWDEDKKQCVKKAVPTPEETIAEYKRTHNVIEAQDVIDLLPSLQAQRSMTWPSQEFVKKIRHLVGLSPEGQ